MQPALQERLRGLASAGGFQPEVVTRFGTFLEEAPEQDLFRTNPLRYAAATGTPEALAIELFVHAVKVGILDFAWGVLCRRCGLFLNTEAGLRALADHRRCGMCRIDVAARVDENVEVAFSVSPVVRTLRFHKPVSQLNDDDAFIATFSSTLAVDPQFFAEIRSSLTYGGNVEPDRVLEMQMDLVPGNHYALGAPMHHAGGDIVVAVDGPVVAEVDLLEGSIVPERVELRQGPVTLRVRNRSQRKAIVGVRSVSAEVARRIADGELEIPLDKLPILQAKRLLASQAFRDLFRTESLPADAGLELQSLTMLFTDLKGSTALYDRVGDLRAYALVREHFAVLQRQVATHGGAVVKTMGDAIMASFSSPLPAMRAALAMNDAVRAVGSEILLKVGLHAGGCIAVESNERLDYFGQTVNIAARVQALADGREIVCTNPVFTAPGVEDLVTAAKLVATREQASLKGVEGITEVIRLSEHA